VDDFALRRGRVYGTVLIDLDSHRPVDLLPDREAATFAGWLAEHPGAQVICRDRAGAYADGARTGAPDAVQVADCFHLWSNLAGYVETTVAQHRPCLAQPPATEKAADDPRADLDGAVAAARDAQFEQRAFVRHARERYTAVQELKAASVGIKPIAARLGLARGTVRKYYRATSVDDVLAKARDGRGSILRPWEPYLTERVNAGMTNGSQLFQEIRDQGSTGSKAVVLAYLRPLRAGASTAAPAARQAPKVRTVTRWILTHPEHLDEQETLALKTILTRCPDLQKMTALSSAEPVRSIDWRTPERRQVSANAVAVYSPALVGVQHDAGLGEHRMSLRTSVSSVGSTNQPVARPAGRPPPTATFAPSSWASAM
jgi:hypothetical protein